MTRQPQAGQVVPVGYPVPRRAVLAGTVAAGVLAWARGPAGPAGDPAAPLRAPRLDRLRRVRRHPGAGSRYAPRAQRALFGTIPDRAAITATRQLITAYFGYFLDHYRHALTMLNAPGRYNRYLLRLR